MRVEGEIPNEFPGVLTPRCSVAVSVGIRVLEHEKVDVVTRPAIVKIERSIEGWEGELWNHLHRSVKAACRCPRNGVLHHGTADGINGPPVG